MDLGGLYSDGAPTGAGSCMNGSAPRIRGRGHAGEPCMGVAKCAFADPRSRHSLPTSNNRVHACVMRKNEVSRNGRTQAEWGARAAPPTLPQTQRCQAA